MLRAGLLNFSKGVLSEQLLGRVDVSAYNAGMKRGDNVVILKQGGFSIRPGFRMISEALHKDERLISFQFSDEQPYALAFGEKYLQPLTGGGVILEDELQITGVSSAAKAVITATLHGYSIGDPVFIDGVQGDLGIYMNDRIFMVAQVLDADRFSINLDTRTLPAFTYALGGIVRSAPPAPPPPPPDTPEPLPDPTPPPVYGGGGDNIEPDIDWWKYPQRPDELERQ